jgi:hypothetical protein
VALYRPALLMLLIAAGTHCHVFNASDAPSHMQVIRMHCLLA